MMLETLFQRISKQNALECSLEELSNHVLLAYYEHKSSIFPENELTFEHVAETLKENLDHWGKWNHTKPREHKRILYRLSEAIHELVIKGYFAHPPRELRSGTYFITERGEHQAEIVKEDYAE